METAAITATGETTARAWLMSQSCPPPTHGLANCYDYAQMARRGFMFTSIPIMLNSDAAHLQMDHILTTLEEAAYNPDWTTTQHHHQV